MWSAGAGGKGGPERTKKVDYEGALKVFDAIEGVQGKKPRLILVSAVDVRDRTKLPSHYVSDSICLRPSYPSVACPMTDLFRFPSGRERPCAV